ncbi:amidoligase family protein [Spartinivicinus ruber]|uniref:amidoligase family protein n=1 Tax=Spartinivicinus ruber TaxID=2683272 RepID=UPI0013D26FDC|nr:amidoligase family protein [Spartinivicinus ruber]
MDQSTNYKVPPVVNRDDGSPRRVGFELEFSGLTLEQVVDTLQVSLGAELQKKTAAEQLLYVDLIGKFNVELDWNYLKRKAAEAKQNGDDEEWIEQLSDVAALLVPVEVVCPPIPVTELAVLDPMISALRLAGAAGTEESLLSAYGVHINPEIPSLDATTLASYLKAFAILQWWLVQANEVDPTRKISPYIDLYSEEYMKQVLSNSSLSMEEIFSDYLAHNGSRNRALDLLPLLAEIDEDRVRNVVDDPKIKARPTFHYRLPDCNIEQPDWSLAIAWNTWWVVEELASRPADLDELGAAFLEADRPILGVNRKNWVAFIDQWLKNHELV